MARLWYTNRSVRDAASHVCLRHFRANFQSSWHPSIFQQCVLAPKNHLPLFQSRGKLPPHPKQTNGKNQASGVFGWIVLLDWASGASLWEDSQTNRLRGLVSLCRSLRKPSFSLSLPHNPVQEDHTAHNRFLYSYISHWRVLPRCEFELTRTFYEYFTLGEKFLKVQGAFPCVKYQESVQCMSGNGFRGMYKRIQSQWNLLLGHSSR